MFGRQKGKISNMELWAAMSIFLSSIAMTAPMVVAAENKSWLAIVIGIIFGLAITVIYAHLSDLNPGKSLIEIGGLLFGKWGGKTIGLLYGWFSLEVSSYILKDNWQMTSIVALPRTPIIVIAAMCIIFVIWITYGGIETIGRLSIIVIPLLLFYLLLAFIFLISDFNLNNLLPITEIEWRKIFYSAVQFSIFPLSNAVLFTMVFPSCNKRGRAKAASLYAVAAAGMVILLSNTMYLLVLGPLASKLTYPGYTTYSYILVADFIERAEVLFYTLFLTMNIIGLSVTFYVGALCLAEVFGVNNYRILLIPLGLLVLEWSTFIVKNHTEHVNLIMFSWTWYAMIYQLVIPLALLIFSFFRQRVHMCQT